MVQGISDLRQRIDPAFSLLWDFLIAMYIPRFPHICIAKAQREEPSITFRRAQTLFLP